MPNNKPHSEEAKAKMSKAHLAQFKDPVIKEKHRQSIIASYTPEVREKHRIAMLNRYSNPNEVERTRQATLKRYEDPKAHEITSMANEKRWEDTKAREHQRLEMLRVWANPEYKSRVVRATAKAQHKSPNIPETILINVLDTYFPNEWEFKGNSYEEGDDVDGKRPDFRHKQNKWIIEHFGDFHHTLKNKTILPHQTYDGRMNFLTERGFKTLILWEKEVKKQPIIEIANKIKDYFYKQVGDGISTVPRVL